MSRDNIRAIAEARSVPYLLHFTRATNIPSIMAHGLRPIADLRAMGVGVQVNDDRRLDGRPHGTSLSIGHPNSRMFYKYRMDNPELDWAILVVAPSVLWEKDCGFCRHNAADARVSTQSAAALKMPQAFESMFEEIEGFESREAQRLKAYDPTDGQAEVMVFDVIEPSRIYAAVFEKAAVKDMYAPHLQERNLYIHANNKGLYAARSYVRR